MIPINKPCGMVSKDVSRWLQRRLGKVKLGHVGTLDPLAEGVLPVLFGVATRLQDYLLDQDKAYEFDVTLGIATDSMDREGQVVAECPWQHVTMDALAAAARSLLGQITQVPPIYSAIKYQGKPLYEYARSGKGEQVDMDRVSREVTIHSLELLGFSERIATFSVSCSKGTYVRSLAVKIGEIVGSCGMVSRLVRTKAAGVDLAQCVTLETLESHTGRFHDWLVPIEDLHLGLARLDIRDSELMVRCKHGQRVVLSPHELHEKAVLSGDMVREAGVKQEILLVDSQSRKFFGLALLECITPDRYLVQMRRGLE